MSSAADWRLALAVGGASGLALSPFLAFDGDWTRPVIAVSLAVALTVNSGRARWPGIVAIGLAAGLAGLFVGGARVDAIDRQALDRPPGRVEMEGFVLEPPSASRGILSFVFRTSEGKLLVEADAALDTEIRPGESLRLEGELAPAPDWRRDDLRRRGITMVLRAGKVTPGQVVRRGVTGFIDRLRNRAFEALQVSVPDREAALSRGFVLGDDSEIDARTVGDFRRSGLAHLLAVSGQNVVLLSLLAVPFLALLGLGPRVRLAAIAGLILVYIPLAGGGPSIQRAGVMGLAGLAALAATRAPSRAYALALAALITLLLNPRASGDIGWQLSFSAVAGIMLMARPLQERLKPLIGEDGWRRPLSEGVSVTLAATIATAPLMVFHFEQLPVTTVLANLAAMPAVAPAMWMGMISVAAGQIDPGLAAPFNLLGSVFLAWIAQVAAWTGRPDWAVAELTLPGPVGLIGAFLILALALALVFHTWRPGPVPIRPSRWIPGAAMVLLLLALVVPGLLGSERRDLAPPPSGGARIEFLDIGQGDAILLRPAGGDPILVDGGPPGGDLPGALRSADVDRLAAVLLTHPDLDHYGGLPEVFGRFPVGTFLFDQAPPELISQARQSGSRLRVVTVGDRIAAGSLTLEIIWPPAQGGEDASGDQDSNARSIVGLLMWKSFRMLLTGDAEAETVPMNPGPIDVLKVSHHGSEDTGLPSLLDRTSPRLAVISAGRDNRHGHPVASVLASLASARVEIRRTDLEGTVSVVLGGTPEIEVETGP